MARLVSSRPVSNSLPSQVLASRSGPGAIPRGQRVSRAAPPAGLGACQALQRSAHAGGGHGLALGAGGRHSRAAGEGAGGGWVAGYLQCQGGGDGMPAFFPWQQDGRMVSDGSPPQPPLLPHHRLRCWATSRTPGPIRCGHGWACLHRMTRSSTPTRLGPTAPAMVSQTATRTAAAAFRMRRRRPRQWMASWRTTSGSPSCGRCARLALATACCRGLAVVDHSNARTC